MPSLMQTVSSVHSDAVVQLVVHHEPLQLFERH
jgi:hypothetical protein